jgi:serine/threonine-protein kinase HipA
VSYQPQRAVDVWMWGDLVGRVAINPRTGYAAFRYADGWLAGGTEIAPLTMPLAARTYEFADLDEATFRRLPPLLADALPDRFGNALIDRWMSERGIRADEFTVIDRLAYAADRAIGALEFRPPASDPNLFESTAVQLADLVVAARSALGGDTAVPVDQSSIEQLIAVGTSAGGARPKAIVAYNPATNQIRSAYRDLPDGFSHWLFKLDGAGAHALDGHTPGLAGGLSGGLPGGLGSGLGVGTHYGQIEYAYHLMAVEAGVTMTRCELLAEGDRRHFITRRFDRDAEGNKIHVVSLCGLAHLDFNMIGAHSYDQYFDTIERLGLGPDSREQAFRRMVFNVIAANCDDHTKNFAFTRRPHSGWELAPAYDVTFAHDPDSMWTRQHLMSVNGKFTQITIDDLHAVAARHAVPGYKSVTKHVQAAVARWPEFAARASVHPAHVAAIADTLATQAHPAGFQP